MQLRCQAGKSAAEIGKFDVKMSVDGKLNVGWVWISNKIEGGSFSKHGLSSVDQQLACFIRLGVDVSHGRYQSVGHQSLAVITGIIYQGD